MYIKDDEINRIFNEKNWKIAHSYYKDNVITNMSVLKQGNEYHIDGTVEIYGRSSTCHIVVDTGGKKMCIRDRSCTNRKCIKFFTTSTAYII